MAATTARIIMRKPQRIHHIEARRVVGTQRGRGGRHHHPEMSEAVEGKNASS